MQQNLTKTINRTIERECLTQAGKQGTSLKVIKAIKTDVNGREIKSWRERKFYTILFRMQKSAAQRDNRNSRPSSASRVAASSVRSSSTRQNIPGSSENIKALYDRGRPVSTSSSITGTKTKTTIKPKQTTTSIQRQKVGSKELHEKEATYVVRMCASSIPLENLKSIFDGLSVSVGPCLFKIEHFNRGFVVLCNFIKNR